MLTVWDSRSSANASTAVMVKPLVSLDLCAVVKRLVFEFRDRWTRRSERGFYSLGHATYMDLREGRLNDELADRIRRENEFIEQVFGWLLEELEKFLMAWTGRPLARLQSLPIPGFHIWEKGAIPQGAGGSRHFDLQYQSLLRAGLIKSAESTLSFTVPISVPVCGAGLRVWNMHYSAYRNEGYSSVHETASLGEEYSIPYSVASIVVHSGLWLHQIAPTVRVMDGDIRLMLQGHAVLCEGSWVIYW